MALQITITDAGRAEVINATNTGTAPVEITEIGVGTGQYVPNPTQTALVSETKRLSTIAGVIVDPDTIHVTIKDETSDAYDVSEFGLYTASGTLFAVYSEVGTPFIQKTAQSTLLLAVDIILGTLDATNLTFGDTSFANPTASPTVFGVVKTMDGQQDTDEDRVLQRGAWGLGKILPIADADLAVESGFYSMPAFLGANNIPPEMAGQSGSLLVTKGGADTNYISQTWTLSNDTDSNRQFIRHKKGAGAWSPWDETATQAFVNSKVGAAVAGTRNVSEIDVDGVLEITPADGKYIALAGHGAANFTITGFGSQCPVGYEFTLHVPRTIADLGGASNSLGNYVQFVHTASGDGLDLTKNKRMLEGSALYTYQAYPNANAFFGDAAALKEELKFIHLGLGRWNLVDLPTDIHSANTNGSITRAANGEQAVNISIVDIDVPITTGSGNVFRTNSISKSYPARFDAAPVASVFGNAGSGQFVWFSRNSVPANDGISYNVLATNSITANIRSDINANGRWKPNV